MKNQNLSYAELNAWANRLAHQLITLGVAPDQRVAICVSRSPAMVVGIVGRVESGRSLCTAGPGLSG
ncbi:AMP-binding protein [Xenorhabdus siamensis]|uniref:AMP-binding protein n=1 Tax=Xenorhabdus siamensis TaxID=3136254 RepID=UPI0030F37583